MKAILVVTLFLQIILFVQGQNVLQCPTLRVFFEIDSSLSITQDSFNNEVNLVRNLINSIRHSAGSQAGFITFNSQVILNSLSSLSTDLEIQLLRLNALALSVDTTSLTNALRYANESVFTEVTFSTNPRNILVLLTDGIDTSADMSQLSAISGDLTNQKSTTVIVVGFGNIPDTTQLQAIASPVANNANLRLFADSASAATGYQSIFTETNVCNSVPLEAPTNPTASLIEPRVVVIAWVPPTSPVTAFRVCYTTNTLADITNVCENSVEAPLSASTQSINSLTPFTPYRYAVFSINNDLILGSTVEDVTTAQEGSSVSVENLAAEVISYNTATVTWQAPPLEGRNGIITQYDVCYLPLGSEICQPLETLNVQELTDTVSSLMANTQYTVRVTPLSSAAVQPRGETSEVSFTTPRFPSITLLTASALSDSQISVEWTQPNYPVTSYRLTATNGSEVITVTPSGSATNFVILGASPFTTYTIMIEANTVNGLSLPSNTLTAITFEAVPSGQVQNLMADGFTPTSIQVNFTEPPRNLWNGILTSYFICVKNIPGIDCVQSAFVDYAPSVSHVIPGLISDTQYNVSVLASNIAGTGPEIADLATTPAADISPVNFLRGSQSAPRQVTLYWMLPSESGDSSLVGGIRVCYGMVGVDCQFSLELDATQTTVTIDLPEAISPYSFAVSLTTPTGSRGMAATIQIPINIIEVRSLMTEAVSTSEIVASWTAPSTTVGYVLTSYSVEVRVAGGTALIRSINTSPEVSTIIIQELNPNTEYTTTVIPVIQQNFFIRNQSSSATTFPVSPPDAPQTVSVDFALTRALRVSWTPPTTPIGSILTYEIVYEGTVIDTLGVRSVNATMNQLFGTIIMLEEAETYSIQIRARYANGPGSLSVPVQGTTLEDVPSSPVTNLQASTGSDNVRVTWSELPLLFRNGVISRYDVICNYTDASGSYANITNSVDGLAREATLYNLPDQTTCSITVVPHTQVGPGPVSEAVLVVTQDPLNSAQLCDNFRISLSVVTILCTALIVTIILLGTIMLIDYVKNHRIKNLNDSPAGMELYAQPHLKPL